MSLASLKKRTALAIGLALALPAILVVAPSAGGRGALVEYENLVLRADGAFEPRLLPKRSFAPIEFEGRVSVAGRDGTPPVPLRQITVEFDRDGRLDPTGLPSCAPEQIAQSSTQEARALCRGAIVGSGRVEALIRLPTGPIPASSPLTIFNGPRQDGHPTLVLHARTTVPGTQTYALLVPITRQPGEYRYRATLEIPPIAAGFGTLTLIEVKINRRFRSGGEQRSYVSARCSDSILSTHGSFRFEDGTLIEGSVEKFCRARPTQPPPTAPPRSRSSYTPPTRAASSTG